jgi:hypothetical protein
MRKEPKRRPSSRRETGAFFFGLGIGFIGYPGWYRFLGNYGWLLSLVGLGLMFFGLAYMRSSRSEVSSAASSDEPSA